MGNAAKDMLTESKQKKGFAVITLSDRQYKHDPIKVPVTVNGYRYELPRRSPVPVPVSVIGALRHATEPVPEDTENDAFDSNIRRRKVVELKERFPFVVNCFLTEAQYQELRTLALSRLLTEADLEPFIPGA